jgi:hypothetical protein
MGDTVGAITAKHYNYLKDSLSRFMVFLGEGYRIESISTLDLQNYKGKLQISYASVDRQNLYNGLMKAMIWLGLNCGFGCTDYSRLQWKGIDFKNNTVKLTR